MEFAPSTNPLNRKHQIANVPIRSDGKNAAVTKRQLKSFQLFILFRRLCTLTSYISDSL
jgi:hypothetical protein